MRQTPSSGSSRRIELLFAAGCVVGLVLAGKDIVMPAPRPAFAETAQGVLAVVNGVTINTADYRSFAARDAPGGSVHAGEIDPGRLDRLIEEELLVQRAKAIGIERGNGELRQGLLAAMTASIVQESQMAEPSPQQLEEFYQENGQRLAKMTRVWLREIRIDFTPQRPAAEARRSAAAAAARLRRGEPLPEAPGDSNRGHHDHRQELPAQGRRGRDQGDPEAGSACPIPSAASDSSARSSVAVPSQDSRPANRRRNTAPTISPSSAASCPSARFSA